MAAGRQRLAVDRQSVAVARGGVSVAFLSSVAHITRFSVVRLKSNKQRPMKRAAASRAMRPSSRVTHEGSPMATSFFNSKNDPKLANGSQFFARKIAEDPARYGLSEQDAAEYVAIDATWQAAYRAARTPSTRTTSAVVGKNVARDAMRRAASRLGQLIGAQSTVSDADKSLLGLAVRAAPTPMGPPGTPDRFASSVNAIGQLTITWDCKQPRGSTGVMYVIHRRIGAAGEFAYLGHVGERRFVDAKLPAGAANVTYQVQAVRSTATGEMAEHNVSFGNAAHGIVAHDGTWLKRAA